MVKIKTLSQKNSETSRDAVRIRFSTSIQGRVDQAFCTKGVTNVTKQRNEK
jgi:hypothetical protein